MDSRCIHLMIHSETLASLVARLGQILCIFVCTGHMCPCVPVAQQILTVLVTKFHSCLKQELQVCREIIL